MVLAAFGHAGEPTEAFLETEATAFGVDRRCWVPKAAQRLHRSSLGVAEVGTGQLARIIERQPTPPLGNTTRGNGLAASDPNVVT
jgi:hypothetical protein